jgi:prepilin-type N-terminal cleavage/methylation domain-containing protein
MRKKGFTLIELLVVIAIIAMLLAILMPALSKVKKIAMRVVCGTNLKGLGTAQTVYANDYDDAYTVQGGTGSHTWSNITNDWEKPAKVWSTAGNITVGASLFLLVREADVSPKSFVCPSGNEKEWDANTFPVAGVIPDMVEVWDFGANAAAAGNQGPENCVSYSYHQPYVAGDTTQTGKSSGQGSRLAADGTRSAAFAVMADRSPYFDTKLTNGGATATNWMELTGRLTWNSTDKWAINVANAQPHDRESQNIVFADGHSSNETRTDVGMRNDGIYVPWGTKTPNEDVRRNGKFFTVRLDAYAWGLEDSVLVNDHVDPLQ